MIRRGMPIPCRRPGADGHRDRFRHPALFLVVLLASRGLTGTDHVDGRGRILSFWLQHLPVLPIVTPLVAGALMLLLADTSRHAGARSPWCPPWPSWPPPSPCWPPRAARAGWPGGVGVYLVGDWAAPFGIVLVVDRLAAVMLTLTSVLGLAADLRAGALGPCGVHFHSCSVPADGPERRLPDRRPVQPVRVLRGAAGRVLRPAAARLGRGARQRRHAVHRREPGGIASCC